MADILLPGDDQPRAENDEYQTTAVSPDDRDGIDRFEEPEPFVQSEPIIEPVRQDDAVPEAESSALAEKRRFRLPRFFL